MSNHKFILKPIHLNRGSTLLEVLISVFIMAFGIMALMLAQLKSVGNVREAEMQTRVAQAVQNLSAGMLSTPDVINNIGTHSAATTKFTYTDYNKSTQNITPTSSAVDITVCGNALNPNATGIKRKDLIACQLNAFTAELQNALPNATGISYAITSTSGDTPTTTIEVKWTESNGDTQNSDDFNYSYSAVVGD